MSQARAKRTKRSAAIVFLVVLSAAYLVPGAPRAAAAAGRAGPASPASQTTKEPDFKPHIIIVPLLYYTPETRLAFGVGGNLNYRFGLHKKTNRPSSLWLIGVYTQNKQYQLSVKPEIYLENNSYLLGIHLKHERFPQRFYGTGNDLPSSVTGEAYTPEMTFFQLSLKRRLWKNLYAGFQYEAEMTKIENIAPGGLLDKSGLEGKEGGLASGLGLTLAWDNRDNIFFPRHGSYLLLAVDSFARAFASDFSYRSLKFDLRGYIPLAEDQALALQAYFRIVSGAPPFYRLSMLGGDTILRGYYKGLYRDKNAVAVQAEYRVPVTGRFGVVGFAGLGKVAASIKDLLPAHARYTIGTGLRYRFDPQEGSNLRLDLAWGKGVFGFYFTAQEAF